MFDANSIKANAIIDGNDIAAFYNVNANLINSVSRIYPMLINPYYFSLIKKANDPIWRQAVPNIKELLDDLPDDPLHEEENSPVTSIIHRYRNRVVLLVTNKCAMYCRFCTRKRRFNTNVTMRQVDKGLNYIMRHKSVKEVIISGGDPLMLCNENLKHILQKLESIEHINLIRIGTRMPVTFPMRIDDDLIKLLKINKTIVVNTHFNHPTEITELSTKACNMFVENGIPVFNQTVLLKGVNDNYYTLKKLFERLIAIKVKPYYLFMTDLVAGNSHFRVPFKKAYEIINKLDANLGGLAVPKLMIDLPDGGGKIEIAPNMVVNFSENGVILKNYDGKIFIYPE